MSIKTISRVLLAALVAIGLVALLSPAEATAGGCLDQTGCERYQECGHCCTVEAETVDITKKCFEVECKVICIPRVVFPWQKKSCDSCSSCDGLGCNACVHNGARTRTIKVIKSAKKTVCSVCEYSWTPEKKACLEGCDAGCCDAIGAAPAAPQAAPVVGLSATTELETVRVTRAPQRLPATR